MRGYWIGSVMLLAGCGARIVDLGDRDAATPEIDATTADDGASSMPDGGSTSTSDVMTPPVSDSPTPTLDPALCPCTRRPGPTQSWKCPLGGDQSTTQVVGPGGGTIKLRGQQSSQQNAPDFELMIQPSALSSDTAITVTETSLSPPATYHDDSPVYRVAPADLQLSTGARLTVPHGNTWNEHTSSGYVDAGAASRQLIYASYDEGATWALTPDSTANITSSYGTLTRGGLYFVGFPRRGIETTCP